VTDVIRLKDGRAPRIFVAEDEFLVALETETVLTQLGCHVVGPANTFAQAEAMARGEAFDAAIVDVNLRGIEIYPVAEVIAARGIPFAFATGFSAEGLAAAHRARPRLQKPFHDEQMREILRVLLGL
jgi:CheY-like chemotaxis protein